MYVKGRWHAVARVGSIGDGWIVQVMAAVRHGIVALCIGTQWVHIDDYERQRCGYLYSL